MLSVDEVKHIAKLSQLKLSKSELELLRRQLSEVVDYISALNEVDTAGVKPTSQTTGLANITRKDVNDPTKSLTKDEGLSNGKKLHNGYFVVPITLENRTI